ncbi:hypothetical protein NMG60_11015115 [Bertholletia excelsa]
MKIMKKVVHCLTSLSFLLVLPPVFVGCSSHEHFSLTSNNKSIRQNIHKASNQKISAIRVHGILLWVSMGFLMPLGILVIRMSNRDRCRRRFKLLFYFHAIFQTLSVLLVTAGAFLSIRSFENSFNNHHQRIGLALYGAIWLQALTAFRRPRRGSKGRCFWYFAHWILGTTICVVGTFNIYTGLEAYHKRTSKGVGLWTILFTAQIFFMAFFYLLQDKWEYVQRQGVIMGSEPTTPSQQVEVPQSQSQRDNNSKDLVPEPARKSNSLGNYFAKSNALNKLFQLT